MVLESELKFLDVDIEATSRRLADLGGEELGRYFESNTVFDYPDRSLKKKGVLLRLREKQGQAVLTVKRPPKQLQPTELKVFEEIETKVGDHDALRDALLAVGFREAFGYEKVREKWRFMDCVVCLDTLPFGDFIEIEGTEITVNRCADALGLGSHETTKQTYHGLNIEYRHGRGLDMDENFRFEPPVKERLLASLR